MFKVFFLACLLLAGLLTIPGQEQEKVSKPTWERYTALQKVSVLFPKMPVLDETVRSCEETASVSYWAYAEEAAYELTIVYKHLKGIPDGCDERANFGRETYEKRLKEINHRNKFDRNGLKGWKSISGMTTRWIFDDLKNNRWFELSVIHRPDVAVDADRFINSLDTSGERKGTEIGPGSLWTIGDPLTSGNPAKDPPVDPGPANGVEEIVIVAKVKAHYTDMARPRNIQGSVTLRVVFLNNGALGAVTPVSGLPYGLTEQAIAAAKKIVFLPRKTNGTTTNVTRTVQYVFSID
jgi:TonB family protein